MVIADGESVVATGADLNHPEGGKIGDQLWLLYVLEVPMAKLPLVIRLSAATPGEHPTHLIKCNRVKVAAINLNHPRLLLNE